MSEIADWVGSSGVFDWLVAYTYVVVFVGTLVDASGLPFPGRLLLAAAGAVAASGRRSVVAVILIAAIAAMVMDHVWYVAGARGSTGILRIYRGLGGYGEDDAAATEYAGGYGAATIVLGRFFTSVRALAWPLAATRGVSYPKFLVLDLFAAALWASLWVLLGWIVAERWRSAVATVGPWLGVAAMVVLAVVLMPPVTRILRRRRRRSHR